MSATPEGYHSVTAYLLVDNGKAALEFYKQAFHALEAFVMPTPDGKIGHAELRIGDSVIMLADECPEADTQSPHTLKGSSVGLMLYTENCDQVLEHAVHAGAKLLRPAKDQFYGDRSGTIEDPFGHIWTIATHKEDLTPEQIQQRAAELFSQ